MVAVFVDFPKKQKKQNCSWVQFLTERYTMKSFSAVAVAIIAPMTCLMEVGAYGTYISRPISSHAGALLSVYEVNK